MYEFLFLVGFGIGIYFIHTVLDVKKEILAREIRRINITPPNTPITEPISEEREEGTIEWDNGEYYYN